MAKKPEPILNKLKQEKISRLETKNILLILAGSNRRQRESSSIFTTVDQPDRYISAQERHNKEKKKKWRERSQIQCVAHT